MVKHLIKTETVLKTNIINNGDVGVLIFCDENSNVQLLERSMIKWVECAVQNYLVKSIQLQDNKSEFQQIKRNLLKIKYTIVLYSFNPLLTQKNIELCLDYLVCRGDKLIKLPFGYVFETDYFKKLSEIKEPVLFSADASEFLKISDQTQIGYAVEVLQRRIIQNLIFNNVQLINPQNIVVNANVVVESGVTIYPFNTLCGETVIKQNAILKEGNTISNSEIGANSAIANSIISDSTIASNVVIFPFNTIENNSFIGTNCVVKSYNKINNGYIGDNTTIESFNDIGN